LVLIVLFFKVEVFFASKTKNVITGILLNNISTYKALLRKKAMSTK